MNGDEHTIRGSLDRSVSMIKKNEQRREQQR